MRYKVLLLAAVFSLSTLLAEAKVFRGGVGGGGARSFTLSVNLSCTALIHLIYDNRASDLDIVLAAPIGGQLVEVASSTSTLRQFEQLEVGILGQLQYRIIVLSSRGGSPFRLNVDGSLGIASVGDGEVAQQIVAEVKEVELDAASLKLIEQVKRKHAALKHKLPR